MNATPPIPHPPPAALPDADLSALHGMAQAQCERGSPDACCVVAAWQLLVLTARALGERGGAKQSERTVKGRT